MTKIAIASLLAISLNAVIINPSFADEPSLTYSQFTDTAGYKDLSAAMDGFRNNFLTEKSGLMHLSVNSDAGVMVIGRFDSKVTANSTSRRLQMTNDDQMSGTSYSEDYGLANGVYFGSIETYSARASITNSSKILSRLGKAGAAFYKTNTASQLGSTGLVMDNFDSSQLELVLKSWDMLSLSRLPNAKFSEVVKSANLTNSADTDYGFDFSFTSQLSTKTSTGHTQVTVSGDGKTYKALTVSKIAYYGGIMVDGVVSSNLSIDTNQVVEIPNLESAVDLQTFKTMKTQIAAEDSAKSKAQYLVTKARALASKAKQSLASSHLTQAAKTLKYTVSPIKNGVKLTTKVGGLVGGACITIINKKVYIKTC